MSGKIFDMLGKKCKVLICNLNGKLKPENTVINASLLVDYNKEDDLIDQLESHDYDVIEIKEKKKNTALIKLKVHTHSAKETQHVIDELYMYDVLKLVIEDE